MKNMQNGWLDQNPFILEAPHQTVMIEIELNYQHWPLLNIQSK